MLISLPAVMMKLSHGPRWFCENFRSTTPHFVSVQQAVRLLGVARKRRVWWRDCSRLTPCCELPTSRMYWARTGNQNTLQNMQMLYERRAYLNDDGLQRAGARP